MMLIIFGILLINLLFSPSHVHSNESKIVQGSLANLAEIPYQVSLQKLPRNTSFCGGTILNVRLVLTAAWCLKSWNITIGLDEFRIVSETTDLNGTNENGSSIGQIRFPLKMIIHEDFSDAGGNLVNDIALIVPTEPFIQTPTLRGVPLRTSTTNTGEWCLISGFGATMNVSEPKGVLRKAEVQIFDHESCKDRYGSSMVPITDDMICAANGGKDACQEDGGGPLVCAGELAGIISFGLCAFQDFPGVYTEVFRYNEWIVENSV